MLYQDQLELGPNGSCLATCVANLLNLPVDEVPNFLTQEIPWWKFFHTWLGEKGFSVIIVDNNTWGAASASWANCLCIACGQGPRGLRHAVVWKIDGVYAENRGHIVHDPHPSHAGLVGEPDEFYFLVPNDPGAK